LFDNVTNLRYAELTAESAINPPGNFDSETRKLLFNQRIIQSLSGGANQNSHSAHSDVDNVPHELQAATDPFVNFALSSNMDPPAKYQQKMAAML
jgi:hypothetical protein